MKFKHSPLQLFSGCCVCLLVAIAATSVVVGRAAEPPNVLDLPALLQQQAIDNLRAVSLLRSGDLSKARLLLRQCVLRVPHDMMAIYNLACADARLGQTEEALEMLQAALKLGFRNKQQLEKDEDLASLRQNPQFAEILKGCDAPPPKQVEGWQYKVQVAQPKGLAITVDHDNMIWNQSKRVMHVFINTQDLGKDRLAISASNALGDKILKWYAAGSAAGNAGDIYDNHDRGHSRLEHSRFPQLAQIAYGPEVQKRQMDNGPQALFLYVDAQSAPAPDKVRVETGKENEPAAVAGNGMLAKRTLVIGNSSTAVTGSVFWRSMPRLILTAPGGVELLTQHYTNNHLYVYPEHKDHDPGYDDANGWGDVFFANTPFYLISQGSSGSDQPILEALAATLASFPPETKRILRDRGLMAPTLQMIFRRCYKPVGSDKNYLTGIAHPTVFDGTQVDADAMTEMAHAMQPDDIPPIVALRVLKEKSSNPQVDYFDAQASEAVLNTPFAIARVCNSTAYWRDLTVTAADSLDINHRPLEFHWTVLRGDPERIKIEPVPDNPKARRIRVGYHERRPIQTGSKLESSRVDIAVVAHNGVHYSAPAFLSFLFPNNEKRIYDDQQRIVSVDYLSSVQNYVDPALVPERLWKDEYHYASTGELTGWTRTRGDRREEFNADGQLLLQSSAPGGTSSPRPVVYQRMNHKDGRPFISQKSP